jgi:hypothetical protein
MLHLIIVNDGTGKENIGNYKVTVNINNREISAFRVKGHDRSKGWKELLRQIVEELYE